MQLEQHEPKQRSSEKRPWVDVLQGDVGRSRLNFLSFYSGLFFFFQKQWSFSGGFDLTSGKFWL